MTAGCQLSTWIRSSWHHNHLENVPTQVEPGYTFSARIEAPRCSVQRGSCRTSTSSRQTGRDDLPGPETPCFTVDADNAEVFAARVQVDPEGI